MKLPNRVQRIVENVRTASSKNGIVGIYDLMVTSAIRRALPTIYKSRLLMRMHHPKLRVVYLEITNECNLRCKMCNFQKAQREIGYMSKTAFKSYVDQLAEIGLDDLFLHLGGESLLHPEFKDFLKYAIRKRNQTGKIGRVLWANNGMLFNRSIADLVIDLEVDSIIFSLDGIGSVNDNIRLGSRYSVIEKNIKYLLERRGSAKKPFVQLFFVDYGKDEEQKIALCREWIDQVDQITMCALILPDNTIGNKKTFAKCTKTSTPPLFCEVPFFEMAISWDGRVTACERDYSFKLNLGDATKVPLKQIWYGEKFQALRKAALTKTFPVDSPCYKCEFWQTSFETRLEPILDGTAIIRYSGVYNVIQKAPFAPSPPRGRSDEHNLNALRSVK